MGGFGSLGYEYDGDAGVRAIAVLKSDTSIKDISVINKPEKVLEANSEKYRQPIKLENEKGKIK